MSRGLFKEFAFCQRKKTRSTASDELNFEGVLSKLLIEIGVFKGNLELTVILETWRVIYIFLVIPLQLKESWVYLWIFWGFFCCFFCNFCTHRIKQRSRVFQSLRIVCHTNPRWDFYKLFTIYNFVLIAVWRIILCCRSSTWHLINTACLRIWFTIFELLRRCSFSNQKSSIRIFFYFLKDGEYYILCVSFEFKFNTYLYNRF